MQKAISKFNKLVPEPDKNPISPEPTRKTLRTSGRSSPTLSYFTQSSESSCEAIDYSDPSSGYNTPITQPETPSLLVRAVASPMMSRKPIIIHRRPDPASLSLAQKMKIYGDALDQKYLSRSQSDVSERVSVLQRMKDTFRSMSNLPDDLER